MAEEKATPVQEYEMDDIRVTLDIDDNKSIECKILSIFEAAGKDYIALIPLDEDGNENKEGDVYLYGYSEDAKGIPSIRNIDDPEEYEAAADRFDEMLDEELYDEMD